MYPIFIFTFFLDAIACTPVYSLSHKTISYFKSIVASLEMVLSLTAKWINKSQSWYCSSLYFKINRISLSLSLSLSYRKQQKIGTQTGVQWTYFPIEKKTTQCTKSFQWTTLCIIVLSNDNIKWNDDSVQLYSQTFQMFFEVPFSRRWNQTNEMKKKKKKNEM